LALGRLLVAASIRKIIAETEVLCNCNLCEVHHTRVTTSTWNPAGVFG
jgi:hypothetical protein